MCSRYRTASFFAIVTTWGALGREGGAKGCVAVSIHSVAGGHSHEVIFIIRITILIINWGPAAFLTFSPTGTWKVKRLLWRAY